MPDAIDTTDGVSSFASAREDAWHQLGVTLSDSFTAEQAMKEAHLGGWNVRKAPLHADDPDTLAEVQVASHVGIVRDNPVDKDRVDLLGITGKDYTIIQNEEHAEFLNALVDESGAHFETAGAILGGSKVFLTMKMPDSIQVGGVDQVDQYLAAVNSFDGSMAFTVMVTPIRIVCQNTLNLALGRAKSQFRIRHTSGARQSITEARRTLDLSFKYLEDFEKQAERLINTQMTNDAFRKMIEAEFGAGEDAPQVTQTRVENRLEEMFKLFEQANTQEGIRNTAWAGLNALTEYADHFSPVRTSSRPDQRALKAVLEPGFKQRAVKAVMATV